jgi:hypothetical protein
MTSGTPPNQVVIAVVIVVAAALMVLSAVARRQLAWRDSRCRVCHRPRSRCTCRWR